MGLLRADAEKLSNNTLVQGIVEELIDRDELFSLLPFEQVNSKAYVYNREKTLSEADFIDPVTDTVPEGAATFESVTETLKVLIGDVDVDNFLRETMSDTNNQFETQIAAKAKGMARKFRRTLAIGDATSNPKEFNGVAKLVTAGQTITAGTNGAALTLSMLDELLDAVPYGADVIMMRAGTLRAHRALLRSLGGTSVDNVVQGEYGPIPAHNGVPIIVNDFLPADEVQGNSSACCSIYAMRLNVADGLHGLYGGPELGIRIEDVGLVQNKDARRTRLKWYCGIALKSTKSLARIKGITNI
ncbi:major capsid protein [Methylocaldum szegediense]|uniref:major capsid protein n=1 Tax=Methylocaldum szegediense TaxID=73780 RepID=UPI000402C759|nr:hypothetical protein [Methylocaldum szegediense]